MTATTGHALTYDHVGKNV